MPLVPTSVACQICVGFDRNRRNHCPSLMRWISTVMTTVEPKCPVLGTSAKLMMRGTGVKALVPGIWSRSSLGAGDRCRAVLCAREGEQHPADAGEPRTESRAEERCLGDDDLEWGPRQMVPDRRG